MTPGAVIISCATMAPERASALAKSAEARGHLYVDAPISGGATRAAEGTLTVLASGSPAAMARAEPVLEALSATLYRLGDEPGIGASFKMVNQLLAGVHIAAASEAIVFAKRLGLDLAKVYAVITGSAGNSWMFENRVPHVLAGDYTPRSAVEIFTKDLGIIVDMARYPHLRHADRRRRPAGLPDDRRRRHGQGRRRLGGAPLRPDRRESTCRASPISATREHATMSPETYEILAIKYAERTDRRRVESFIAADDHDAPHPIDFFVWVIRNPRRTIVVDTGFDEAEGRRRQRTLLRVA